MNVAALSDAVIETESYRLVRIAEQGIEEIEPVDAERIVRVFGTHTGVLEIKAFWRKIGCELRPRARGSEQDRIKRSKLRQA